MPPYIWRQEPSKRRHAVVPVIQTSRSICMHILHGWMYCQAIWSLQENIGSNFGCSNLLKHGGRPNVCSRMLCFGKHVPFNFLQPWAKCQWNIPSFLPQAEKMSPAQETKNTFVKFLSIPGGMSDCGVYSPNLICTCRAEEELPNLPSAIKPRCQPWKVLVLCSAENVCNAFGWWQSRYQGKWLGNMT